VSIISDGLEIGNQYYAVSGCSFGAAHYLYGCNTAVESRLRCFNTETEYRNSHYRKIVLIEQSGTTFVNVNHNLVAVTELKDRLKELLPKNENAVVYSGADDLVYGTVAQTLDTIRDSGAAKIAITTRIEN
jgi:biopolymer transport protein ExbD